MFFIIRRAGLEVMRVPASLFVVFLTQRAVGQPVAGVFVDVLRPLIDRVAGTAAEQRVDRA